MPYRRLTRSVVLFLACLHAGWIAAGEPADSERVQAELERLTEQLNSLDSWLSRAQQRRLRLLADLRAKDRAVAAAVSDVAASDAELAVVSGDLARLDAERKDLQHRQSREAGRIGEHLVAAYRLQGRNFLRLLLDHRVQCRQRAVSITAISSPRARRFRSHRMHRYNLAQRGALGDGRQRTRRRHWAPTGRSWSGTT